MGVGGALGCRILSWEWWDRQVHCYELPVPATCFFLPSLLLPRASTNAPNVRACRRPGQGAAPARATICSALEALVGGGGGGGGGEQSRAAWSRPSVNAV